MTRPLPALALVVLTLSAPSQARAQMISTVTRFDGVVNGGISVNVSGAILELSALSTSSPVMVTTGGTPVPFFRSFGDASMAPAGGVNTFSGTYNILITISDLASGDSGTIDLGGSTSGSFHPTSGISLTGPFLTNQGQFINGFYEIPLLLGSTDYLVTIPGGYVLNANPSGSLEVPMVIAVPEPSSMLLMIGPSLFLWRSIRRQRRQHSATN